MDSFDRLGRLDAIAAERCRDAGPAHDHLHVRRVAATARDLSRTEGADEGISVASALLHELFNYPKDHPESSRSGEVCAEHARRVLLDEGMAPAFADAVAYAIRVHAFSAGIVPDTLEARILQDADRLDAIGAVGIARCFATTAEMKRPFYEPADPFARSRELNDKLWGLDHFERKLFRIPDRLHTASARRLAEPRIAFLRAYVEQLRSEIA